MTRAQGPSGEGACRPLRSEAGFAMVGALLVAVLVTALGSAALFLSQLDLTLAGNYRVQRTAEVAADGGLELVKAMIYGNAPTLDLPLSIPADGTAATWSQAGAYADPDIDVAFTVRYKQEDNINFNADETYADEVVRYGRDYNYESAAKDLGKQPVYTLSFRDGITGAKGEADLISSVGFSTPAAIYVKGRVRMEKNPWANEEMIEVTSGAGTPALATTKSSSGVFIQRATSVSGTGAVRTYLDQTGSSFDYRPDYREYASICNDPGGGGAVLTHPTPLPPYCPLTTLNISLGPYASNQCWPDLYRRVYADAEIAAEIAAGRYNEARDRMHVLLGVGARDANLNGAASYADSKAIFNFDVADAAVVKYSHRNAAGAVPTLEEMLGASFADLRSLADLVLVGDQTVKGSNCSNISGGKDLSGMTLGTPADPRLVFFESNMNDNGTSNGHAPLTLVTTSGSVHGYGILVINGDATIVGSINWTGLMIVRGKLYFTPWQGGTANFRSGPDLMTRWNGFIMIGGDPTSTSEYGLRLWTYFGGGIKLGYTTADVATVKGIIAATVPHKILSWRRAYN